MTANGKKIRILIVDDSKYMRFVLKKNLLEAGDIDVVGEAKDGVEALEQIDALKPDVVTLDVEMPRLNGLETLEKIFEKQPLPVIMVSNLTGEGADATIKALQLGAVDFIQKPQGKDGLTLNIVRQELLEKIRAAAQVSFGSRAPERKTIQERIFHGPSHAVKRHGKMEKIIVIGCSTGGPKALTHLMRELDGDIPAGLLIVQHMPEGFTTSLAARLAKITGMELREAVDGDTPEAGLALMAPGGFHMRLDRRGRISLTKEPEVHNVRPAVDVTLKDVAETYGKRAACVILTGMGGDGTEGAGEIKKHGGMIIAQLGSTCVVNGMPASVINAGYADKVVHLDKIAEEIKAIAGGLAV